MFNLQLEEPLNVKKKVSARRYVDWGLNIKMSIGHLFQRKYWMLRKNYEWRNWDYNMEVGKDTGIWANVRSRVVVGGRSEEKERIIKGNRFLEETEEYY